MEFDVDQVDWGKGDGLVPAIVQDARSGQVLMLGYMNRESLTRTFDSGKVTFWSRSREQLWCKGETSGNYLYLKSARIDCDRDTLLIGADPVGPVCHRGTVTCFEDSATAEGPQFLSHLERLIESRRAERPKGSYTTGLFDRGMEHIAKKLGEEAVELVVSVIQSRERTIEESADLLFHLLVFLAEKEIHLQEVLEELQRRHVGSQATSDSSSTKRRPVRKAITNGSSEE